MNLKYPKYILGFLGLCMMIYMGYQVYSYFSQPFTTETAVPYSVAETIDVEGVVIRSEAPLSAAYEGVLSYLYSDGERVAPGAVVAETYGTKEDALAAREAARLGEEIRMLQQAQDPSASLYVHTDVLSREILEDLGALGDQARQGLISDMENSRRELVYLLNRKQVALEQEQDFSQRISWLETQQSAALAQAGGVTGRILTEQGGYFVKSTDGYERVLTPALLEGLDYDGLQELMSVVPQAASGNVGRIVEDHIWYYAVSVTDRQMELFADVESVQLDFGLANTGLIDAQVYQISTQHPDKNVIVFLCKNISDEILDLRYEAAQVVFRYYSGYRVSTDALRYVDGQEGVYVVGQYEISFVPVTVVYRQGGFVLCDTQLTETNQIRLFDEVIVEGKNIEDAMPVT